MLNHETFRKNILLICNSILLFQGYSLFYQNTRLHTRNTFGITKLLWILFSACMCQRVAVSHFGNYKLPLLDKVFDWFTEHEESTNKCSEEKLEREDAVDLTQEAWQHKHNLSINNISNHIRNYSLYRAQAQSQIHKFITVMQY